MQKVIIPLDKILDRYTDQEAHRHLEQHSEMLQQRDRYYSAHISSRNNCRQRINQYFLFKKKMTHYLLFAVILSSQFCLHFIQIVFFFFIHIYLHFSPQSWTRRPRPCKHYWVPSANQWLVFTSAVLLLFFLYVINTIHMILCDSICTVFMKTRNDVTVLRH